jgi:hypothetical protein
MKIKVSIMSFVYAEMEECRTCGLSAEGGLSLLDPEQQELTDFIKQNLRNGEVRYHNHVWRRKTEP